jgi:Cu/Zn superoxide dismutase
MMNDKKREDGEKWYVMEYFYPFYLKNGNKENRWFCVGAIEDFEAAKGHANDRTVPARVWEVTGKLVHQNSISVEKKRGRPKKEEGAVDFSQPVKKKRHKTPEAEEDEEGMLFK